MKIYRLITEPIRSGLTWETRWRDADKGLISAWEVGRVESASKPELADRARAGELVVLSWKGGCEKELKLKKKCGPLEYLAAWQGLRGEHLDIETNEEITIICSRTKMAVTFTQDSKKYAEPS
jgi:hypothetical protein